MDTRDSKEEFIFVGNAINTVQDSSIEKPLNIERPSGLMKTTFTGQLFSSGLYSYIAIIASLNFLNSPNSIQIL